MATRSISLIPLPHTRLFKSFGKTQNLAALSFCFTEERRGRIRKKEIRFQAYYCTLHEKDLKEMNVPWAATTAAASLALLSPLMLDHR